MQSDEIAKRVTPKLESSLTHFQEEIGKLRTGRANAAVLDKVMVEAYGVPMPLKQLANISAPEVQLLQVTPFDANNLQSIASAIRDDQSLGLNPVDDGKVIRIQIPPLTTERRAEIVKQLNQKMEEALISMRTARHESLKTAEEAKKQKDMSEDDFVRAGKQVDDLMSQYKTKIESLAHAKEQEIMTV